LTDRRGVRLKGKVSGDAARDALRQRLAPFGFFRRELQNAFESRGIERLVFLRISEVWNLARVADQLQPEFQRVSARCRGEFVDKRFDHEAAAGMLHRTPPRARNA